MSFISDTCVFDRKVYESTIPNGSGETKSKSILRTIRGPVAEYGNLNRNGRKYSERLWDNVLASDYLSEQLQYKTLMGEANHPVDRYEVDFARVSHTITGLWKVPESNQIYGEINILNTTLGKILNTIYEAGGIIGYSSRAGGTLHQRQGYIDVDEKTYNFITFDAVPFPSVVSARPGEIVEGTTVVDDSVFTKIHEGICTLIKKSSPEDRETIQEYLKNLDGFDSSKEVALLESYQIQEPESDSTEATMSLLKEGSVQINKLKTEVQSLKALNEKLSKDNVSLKTSLDTSLSNLSKVLEEADALKKMKESSSRIYEDTISELKRKVSELKSDLSESYSEIERLETVETACKSLKYENARLVSEGTISESLQSKVSELSAKLSQSESKVKTLIKEGKEKDTEISNLTSKINTLEEDISDLKVVNEELETEKGKLITESSNIGSLTSENARLKEEVKKLNESVEVIREKSDTYKDEMVAVICDKYNVSVSNVKSKLKAGFTKSDVYSLCEGLVREVSTPVIISEEKEIKPVNTNPVNNNGTSVKSLFSTIGNRRGF